KSAPPPPPALFPYTTLFRSVDPLGYLAFMSLLSASRVVITDSGGIQEETTALGVPCITVRPNTERPVTVTHGTNCLVEPAGIARSEEHTSELQSRVDLVCRL